MSNLNNLALFSFLILTLSSIQVIDSVRIIGGDGTVFLFHGRRDKYICLVSDYEQHVNAQLIGKMDSSHPMTWIKSVYLMFGHSKVSVETFSEPNWDPFLDHIELKINDTEIHVPAPGHKAGPLAEPVVWKSNVSDVTIIRRRVNEVRIQIMNLVDIQLTANSVDEELWTENDCFTHLDVEFKKLKVSNTIHGVIGQTYRLQRIKAARMRYRHNRDESLDIDLAVIGKKEVPAIAGNPTDYEVSNQWSTDCKYSKFLSGSLGGIKSLQDNVADGIITTRKLAGTTPMRGEVSAVTIQEEVNPLDAYLSEAAVSLVKTANKVVEDVKSAFPTLIPKSESESLPTIEEGFVLEVQSDERGMINDDEALDVIPSGLSLESLMNE